MLEMITQVYSRNDFAHKLAELEQQVIYSRKAIKNIGTLQNKFIRLLPMINFTKYLSYLKEGVKDFNKCKETFDALVKELRQRGLPHFLDLFSRKDFDAAMPQQQ